MTGPAGPPPVTTDPFGGHDFRYEPSTDLFRCAICRAYEVTQREEGGIKPCPGPVSGEPMTLNAF